MKWTLPEPEHWRNFCVESLRLHKNQPFLAPNGWEGFHGGNMAINGDLDFWMADTMLQIKG